MFTVFTLDDHELPVVFVSSSDRYQYQLAVSVHCTVQSIVVLAIAFIESCIDRCITVGSL